MTELVVFTFKDGLLSRVAHDLKLTVQDPEVVRAGARLSVTVAVTSLRVSCAMKRGREDHRALSAKDRAEIERTIAAEVLHSDRHPLIRYEGEIVGQQIVGHLTLRGVTRSLTLPWQQQGSAMVGEVRIDQRDFGITPYRAMMGTLKLKPALTVAWRLPAD